MIAPCYTHGKTPPGERSLLIPVVVASLEHADPLLRLAAVHYAATMLPPDSHTKYLLLVAAGDE